MVLFHRASRIARGSEDDLLEGFRDDLRAYTLQLGTDYSPAYPTGLAVRLATVMHVTVTHDWRLMDHQLPF